MLVDAPETPQEAPKTLLYLYFGALWDAKRTAVDAAAPSLFLGAASQGAGGIRRSSVGVGVDGCRRQQ